MPAGLAARLAALAPRRPYLLWPGASTPLGTLGYVSAGLELVDAFGERGWPEPDDVVVALGSGGTAVGTALGIRVGGWQRARVVGVRVADPMVTNTGVLRALEMGTRALLALGGLVAHRGRLAVDGRWFGSGYGAPTERGRRAAERGTAVGLAVEPTYTAKALAAALDLHDRGRRVVFIQTFAGQSTGVEVDA
jgi:D-cysteine desulfhydrase